MANDSEDSKTHIDVHFQVTCHVNLVDHIREQVDIVALIAQTVPLSKEAGAYRGQSPFAAFGADLYVFPSTKTFVDFASNRRGDVFAWIMRIYGLSFDDAVRVSARRIHLDGDSTFD